MEKRYEHELVEKYRKGTLNDLDRLSIDRCFEGHCFERGQLSILFPIHYKAFSILFHNTDVGINELKNKREKRSE